MSNVSILEKSRCLSCRSCYLSCPKSAIQMKENREGFSYHDVSGNCIDCGICVSKCPVLSPVSREEFPQKFLCAYLSDEAKRLQSTSGGMFAALAERTIEDGGVVFGAAYDDGLNVRHISVDNVDGLQKLKGSKYVESDTGDSLAKAKKFLEDGKKVLYSGTPCQIAGLKKYLSKDYDNLYTIDLICHGVPSRKLFGRYIEWLGRRTGGKIIYYGFRDKDVGGWSCGGKTKTKTKTKTIDGSCDPYYASFLRGETYRESCYSCPFANTQRMGDLTIGDFWGVEKFYPEIDRPKGVSCVIVNSRKGNYLLECCADKITLIESAKENVIERNDNLKHPTARPEIRSSIYDGIDGNLNQYLRKFKCRNEFAFKTRKIASRCFPKTLKKIIKKIMRK